MGFVPLLKRSQRGLLPLPPCEDTVRSQQSAITAGEPETDHSVSPEVHHARTKLILDVLTWTVRNKYLLFISHTVYGIL